MGLQSSVLEGSADGGNWAEMDRRTDTRDFIRRDTRTFAVVTPVQCRFIRLIQTGMRSEGTDPLTLTFVEFFGALSE
jgi:hypothetical protein